MLNNVILFKISSGILIWLLAIIGGCLPLIFNNLGKLFNSILNMFAAGVFMSSSFVHLLPDAVENKALKQIGCYLYNIKDTNHLICFPMAYFIFGIGFLLILVVELCAHELHNKYGKSMESFTSHLIQNNKLIKNNNHHDDNKHEKLPLLINKCKYSSNNLLCHHPSNEDNHSNPECQDLEVTHAHIHGIMTNETSILSIIIFISLSFHSIMEGVGIGGSYKKSWDILVAIIAHKSLAAFAMSIEMLHHHVQLKKLFLTILLFSCMTPLGILIGHLIVGNQNTENSGSGICTALAGGTFLFVSIMEIIPQELQTRENQIKKVTSLVVGFAAFSILAIWV